MFKCRPGIDKKKMEQIGSIFIQYKMNRVLCHY